MATRDALDSCRLAADTHAGLWLDRYLDQLDREGAKQEHLDGILETVRVPAGYCRFFARWKAALEGLPNTLLARAQVTGRLIVGLGAESVLEASITLHRTYGVPYLPGLALKGLAAAAAHRQLVDTKWQKAGPGRPIGESHRVLFGDTESSGYVTFHDALWIPEGPRLPLDPDVLTVHHPGYYGGENVPPADWDSPIPVPFASAHGAYLLAWTGPPAWTQAAYDILKDALAKDGLGAKTAAGYGRFKVEPEKREKSQEPKPPDDVPSVARVFRRGERLMVKVVEIKGGGRYLVRPLEGSVDTILLQQPGLQWFVDDEKRVKATEVNKNGKITSVAVA